MATIHFPEFAKHRGTGYWLRPSNLWASRRSIFRSDRSNEWRYVFTEDRPPASHRSTDLRTLLSNPAADGFRFLILGDTGEGDRSQYGLVPVIRQLDPDFLIINGDVVYPAGRVRDFIEGFFQPYRGLGLPIWATPGNHEYYSKHRGREFFETFCSRKWEARWRDHGLRLVPQPGTYWELRSATAGLVVLGIDSGMKADLDGRGRQEPDRRQHFWLKTRLKMAQFRRDKVIVLFHIPALKREKHEKKTHLTALHQTIAAFDCVRLVVCGHDHNYQLYQPDQFAKYLNDRHGSGASPSSAPHYVVVGAGGATLSGTDWSGPYKTADRHPDADEWNAYVGALRRLSERSPLAKTLLGRIIGIFSKESEADQDPVRYQCMLLVEHEGGGAPVRVTPIHVDDLHSLFPSDAEFNVMDPVLPWLDPSLSDLKQPRIPF